VGLLGPNGAGKTTSFYMIVGLIKPNEGKIFLDDVDITGDPMYRRAQKGIGYLAQEASIFRKLSVEDNIKAVLEMGTMPKDRQKDKLEELIDEFSCTKCAGTVATCYRAVNAGVQKLRGHWLLNQTLFCLMNPSPGLTLLR